MTTTQTAVLDRDELLLKAGMMQQRMTHALNYEKKPLVRDQRQKLRYYKNAFLGNEVVEWTVQSGFASSREAATKLFDDFLTVGALQALSRKGHVFQDDTYLYSWPVAGEAGAPSERGSISGEDDEEVAVGDMAQLLHLHTAVFEKNKLRQEEWRKAELPQIRSKIEGLEKELASWRNKLEAAVEKTKRTKDPDVDSLILIDELETAVAAVTKEVDNQKQLMHFPEPEGWLYRFGTDGVYVGFKQIYLEKIEAKWWLRTGSALGPNSAIKGSVSGHHFEMKFSPVVVSLAFDGVSIVGEKGSGVPDLQIERLALKMELFVEAQLHFNTATSTWKAPYFEFNLVEMGKTEVLVLPPSLLQWLINKFAPARLKEAILSSLPVALGHYLAGGGALLDLSGNLAVRGIPFSVLESPMQLGKVPSVPGDLHEAHWSALKLLNTGIDCMTHGHVLSELRRRLGLSALSRNPLFKYSSKWVTLSKMLAYVRTLDREASSMERAEIMRTWQHALHTVTSEDSVSPIDLQALFDRLRLLDRVPFDVNYVVTEFTGSFEVGRLVDSLKDIGNEFLNAAKTNLTNVKVLNDMRKTRTFEDLDVWHRETTTILKKITSSLQKFSVRLSGRLLGGKDGIFDVGTDVAVMRLKPEIEYPLKEIVVAPSDTAMSLFAVEDDGGKFVVDVGVPKSEKIAQEVAETKHESMLSLCTGEFWKRKTTKEEQKSSEVYDGCKHFPNYDRVVMLKVGSSSVSLRADVTSLIKNLQSMQMDESGAADLLSVAFKPKQHDAAASAQRDVSPGSPPRTSITKHAPEFPVLTANLTSINSTSTPTIVAASATLPSLDLDLPPAALVATNPLTPTNDITTIHLSLPVEVAGGELSSMNSNPSLSPVSTPTSSSAAIRRNSIGSPKLSPVSASSQKRHSLGETLVPPPAVMFSPASPKRTPACGPVIKPAVASYEVVLHSLPDVFVQLIIRDLRLMGAPRRISRFIRSTIAQTKQEKTTSETKEAPIESKTESKTDITKKAIADLAIGSTAITDLAKAEGKAPSELDPIHVALHSVLHDIGSDSMVFRFSQSLDVTVQDDKLYVTLARANSGKQADSRPFVFSNSYIARDLYEKIMLVQSAIEKVRAES